MLEGAGRPTPAHRKSWHFFRCGHVPNPASSSQLLLFCCCSPIDIPNPGCRVCFELLMAFAQEVFDGGKVLLVHVELLAELRPEDTMISSEKKTPVRIDGRDNLLCKSSKVCSGVLSKDCQTSDNNPWHKAHTSGFFRTSLRHFR